MTTSSMLRRPVYLAILCAALAAGCRAVPEQKMVTIRARAVGYEKSLVTVARGAAVRGIKGTMQSLSTHDVTAFKVISPKRWAGCVFRLYHERPPEKNSFWRTKGWTFTSDAMEEAFVDLILLSPMPYAAKHINVKPEPPARCVSVKAKFIEIGTESLEDFGCEWDSVPAPPADHKRDEH